MAYGYRSRSARRGTRVGKRRLVRKMGFRKRVRRSTRVVTRRVLSRALAPLRPELKHVDVVNTVQTYIETQPIAIDQYSFYGGPGSIQDGSYTLAKTSLSSPIMLSYCAQGVGAEARVGRAINIKGIDIHMTIRTQSNNPSSEPYYVRVFVFKSKAIGQYQPGFTLPIGTGNFYPHYAPMASASGPVWWYLQTNDVDSFPSWEHTLGGKKDTCQVVAQRRFKMNPQLDDNPAAGTVFMNPMDGAQEQYLNIRIKGSSKTVFNDEDGSLCAGYAAMNHYWLVAFRESSSATWSNCYCLPGDLRWRMRFTDA